MCTDVCGHELEEKINREIEFKFHSASSERPVIGESS